MRLQRRRSWLGVLSLLLGACGPWIIEPPAPAQEVPTAAPAPNDQARTAIAEAFDLDPSALVATADGFVFVARSGGQLQLLLSRNRDTETIEVLARVEEVAFAPDSSGLSSFAVVCPRGSLQVRYYLLGQDTSDVTKLITGLTGVGGEVVDGLWVLAITDDEIAPEQRWEITDAAGTVGIEAGTGERFASDGETIGEGDSVLCEVNEH